MRLFPSNGQIAIVANAAMMTSLGIYEGNSWDELSEYSQQEVIDKVEQIRGLHDADDFDPVFHVTVSRMLEGFDVDGENAAILQNIDEESLVGNFDEANHLVPLEGEQAEWVAVDEGAAAAVEQTQQEAQ